MQRLITAVILIPLLILTVHYTDSFYFFCLASIVILLGLNEFYDLLKAGEKRCYKKIGLALGWLFSLSFFLNISLPFSLTIIFFTLLILALFIKDRLSHGLEGVAYTFWGIIYVSWLFGHLILIRQLYQGREIIYLVFMLTWFNDTFAYYLGSTMGRIPLAPTLSPQKTVEGSIAGIAGSILAAVIAWYCFFIEISPVYFLALGIFSGVAAQLGDLGESLLKRNIGVKDSGRIIPGHGGLLDRIDSLLFSLPVVYYYMLLVI